LTERGRDDVVSDKSDYIIEYTPGQAIADGVLVETFRNRWPQLSGGKPMVATSAVFEEISLAGLIEIWNEYVQWRTSVLPTLREEDRLFHTEMNSRTVWVIVTAQPTP